LYKPVQYAIYARQEGLNKIRIFAQGPVIMNHINPEKREWRNG